MPLLLVQQTLFFARMPLKVLIYYLAIGSSPSQMASIIGGLAAFSSGFACGNSFSTSGAAHNLISAVAVGIYCCCCRYKCFICK
jgi:hypothetical protein